MSRPSSWANVKSAKATAAALYYQVSNVGKTIESSKKRVIWRIKVQEGREFEISLTHSLASGKKVLRVDGLVKYDGQALSFGDWDYVFNLAGGHVIHIIIKPSVELNDMYDLIVDGISFRRLPESLNPSSSQSNAAKLTDYPFPKNSRPSHKKTYRSSYIEDDEEEGATPKQASFVPWECPRCTLVNEKPLAPICEACGIAKPREADLKTVKPVKERVAPLTVKEVTKPKESKKEEAFDPFGLETEAFPSKTSPEKEAAKPKEDFMTMLDGLDFNASPAQPTQKEMYSTAPMSMQQPQSQEIRPPMANGDMWSSPMANMNLNSTKMQPLATNTAFNRPYQTMGQAPMQTMNTPQMSMMSPPAPVNPGMQFNPAYMTSPAMQQPYSGQSMQMYPPMPGPPMNQTQSQSMQQLNPFNTSTTVPSSTSRPRENDPFATLS